MSRLVGSRVLLASVVCVIATSFVPPVEPISASAWFTSNVSPALTKISAWSSSLLERKPAPNGEGPTYVLDDASPAPDAAPTEKRSFQFVALRQQPGPHQPTERSGFANHAPLPKAKPAAQPATPAAPLADLDPHAQQVVPLPPAKPSLSNVTQSVAGLVPLPLEKPGTPAITKSPAALSDNVEARKLYASLSVSDSVPARAKTPTTPAVDAPIAAERPSEPAAAAIAPPPTPPKSERVEASLGGSSTAAPPLEVPAAREDISYATSTRAHSSEFDRAKEFPSAKEFPDARNTGLERHASLGPISASNSGSDAKFEAAYIPPEKRRVAYDAPIQMDRPQSIGKRRYVDDSTYSGRGSPEALLEALRHMGAHAKALGLPPSLWCADFMNLVLKHVGLDATGSRAARSFLKYGQKIDEPRVGAIAIFSRGRDGGHVGIVRGTDGNGNPIVISGNYADRVAEAVYPKSRVLAYVVPRELPPTSADSQPDQKP